MNSQDYRNLQEAYTGVYDDDIREKLEFESWVNNLLEEGYDLSDYTWDELYENYIQLDENSATSRDPDGSERRRTRSRQPDPSKPDFTGMGNMSIDQIRKMSARIEKEKTKKEEFDIYDLILSHLIDEGYADTYESAERIMVNMSEEWRESIVETRMDPRGRPASGPMNVYANPKGKPSQAHLDAVKSYDAEQKKKTPEQRKKELDDYRERQMNNK